MSPSTRDRLCGVALVALALSALGAGGVWVAISQVSLAREQAVARAQESAATLVTEAHAALGREAQLLARDPAIVDGLAKGDWATLARDVSPRLPAVTLDRFADLISVVDVTGRALLRVPALPPMVIPDLSAVSASSPGLTVLDGHPYVVAAAAVVKPAVGPAREARQVGFVVIARQFERLAPLAAGASARPGMLFLVNGRPLFSSLQGSPKADWVGAMRTGEASLDGGRNLLVRAADQVVVAGPGRLWVLAADDSKGRRRALGGWLVTLVLCALASAAASLLLRRESAASRRIAPDAMAEAEMSSPSVGLARRNRELEALNAVAPTMVRPADVASQAAVAIDNTRLFAEAQQSAARYRALFEVSGALASSLDLDRILHAIVERCQALTGAAAAGIFRADADTGLLTYARATGVSSEFLRGLRVRAGEGTSGRALRERSPVWTADILHDSAIPLSTDTRILVEREGYRGALSVPIFIKGEPYGGLTVFWWQPHPASAAEIEVMTALGGQAAVAIENARLLADERSGRASLSALLEVNKKIGLLVPTDTLLASVAEEAMRLLDVDNAGFRLLDGDELVVAGLAGTAPATMLHPRIKVGESLAGKIVAEGRALAGHLDTLPDILPEHLAADRRLGYTHYMGLPLRLGERIIGVLTFRARRAFSRRDQEVAEAFAGQAAVAIEHARLYREAAKQTERMRALTEMGRALVSTFDGERILSLVAAQTKEALGAAVVAVHVHDPDVDLLRFARHSGEPDTFTGTPLVEPGEGVSGRAFVERGPVWTSDIISDPEIRLSPENRGRIMAHGWRAALALPLMRAEPFGTLTVYHETGHYFGQEEIEYLSTVASQLVVALDNARLFEAVEERADRLRSLVRLNQLVSSSLDADEVLAGIARAAAALMGVPTVSVWVAEGASKTLRLRAFSDELMGATYPFRAIAFGQGPIGLVASQRQPLTIRDALADGGLLAESWWRQHALTSFHGEPIVLQDSLLGVLALCGRAPLRLDHDERELLESFVAQAAVAIRNAGLHAQTTQRLQQTRSLLEVAEILNSTLEPRRMLKQVAQRIALVCGVDRCTIELWEGDHVVPLVSQFADGRKEPELWNAFKTMVDGLPRAFPIRAEAIRTRRPAIVTDASGSDQIPPAWVEAFGIKSSMAVPLMRQNDVIGVMDLDCTERITAFEPWQQDLGMAIGNQVALALENQRLYDLVQERLQEATTLLAVSQALSGPEGMQEALRRVAAEVGRALCADMVGVYTLSADRSALIPAAGWHVPKDLVGTFLARPFVLDRMPILRLLLNERCAAWSADVTNDPRIDQQVFEGIGPHSVLCAPTLAGGEPVGGVFLVWWETGRSFTPQEVRMIEGVASQVGLFMENAALTRQTRLRLEESEALLSELTVLHDLARAVTGQLRQDDVVEAIHRQVTCLLDTRHMALVVIDEAAAELVALLRMQDGVRDLELLRRSIHDRIGLTVDVAAAGRPIRTDDYPGECVRRGVEPAPGNEGLPYWIGVPMLAGAQVVGVLTLRSGDRPFSESDERVLTNIAGLAALALRSARLYQDRTRAYEDLALAQDQLVRTENLRALGEMASGVAHDFNNLLAAILGRAQLLLQRVADPTARDWLQIIERSATDGAKTVRRLQEFARVRRDRPAVAVDLNQVVREALEMNESSWRLEPPRRGVVIRTVTTLAADLPMTLSDPAELREVLSSLILNAVEAMPGGGTLTFSTARHGESIELRVADTGVGIPEAVLGKIFDPFFTTKGPTRTGLGLSVAYGILSRHGATITVESREGRGTAFTLFFPVGAPPRAPGSDSGAAVLAATLRCLVVDDDEFVGDMLADILRSAGHTVAVVRSASQGLLRVRSEPLDLVFTDLSMPGMSGWELARAVRDAAPGLPVILISGFAVEVSEDELRATGVHSVLAKPVNVDELLAAAATIRSRGSMGDKQP